MTRTDLQLAGDSAELRVAELLAARAVRNIIDRFCAGSVEQFLAGMVDEKVLSADQLDRLARKVRNRK